MRRGRAGVVGLALCASLAGCDDTAGTTSTSRVGTSAAVATTVQPTTTAPSTTTVTPTTTAAPTTAPATTTPATTSTTTFASVSSVEPPSGTFAVGTEDLAVRRANGDVELLPGALGTSPGPPTLAADYPDPRRPVTEGEGPNVVTGVAGVFDGALVLGDCCEPITGTVWSVAAPGAPPFRALAPGTQLRFEATRGQLAVAGSRGVSLLDARSGVVRATSFEALGTSFTTADALGLAWLPGGFVVLVSTPGGGAALVAVDIGTADLTFGDPVPVTLPPALAGSRLELVGVADVGSLFAVAHTDDGRTVGLSFDPTTLRLVPDSERDLPAGSAGYQLRADGALLWVVDGHELWYEPPGGTPRMLDGDAAAAWFL